MPSSYVTCSGALRYFPEKSFKSLWVWMCASLWMCSIDIISVNAVFFVFFFWRQYGVPLFQKIEVRLQNRQRLVFFAFYHLFKFHRKICAILFSESVCANVFHTRVKKGKKNADTCESVQPLVWGISLYSLKMASQAHENKPHTIRFVFMLYLKLHSLLNFSL